jgi:hypothetical protein
MAFMVCTSIPSSFQYDQINSSMLGHEKRFRSRKPSQNGDRSSLAVPPMLTSASTIRLR